jgi:hypothetical protein
MKTLLVGKGQPKSGRAILSLSTLLSNKNTPACLSSSLLGCSAEQGSKLLTPKHIQEKSLLFS